MTGVTIQLPQKGKQKRDRDDAKAAKASKTATLQKSKAAHTYYISSSPLHIKYHHKNGWILPKLTEK